MIDPLFGGEDVVQLADEDRGSVDVAKICS
jgi:hypothetical protein